MSAITAAAGSAFASSNDGAPDVRPEVQVYWQNDGSCAERTSTGVLIASIDRSYCEQSIGFGIYWQNDGSCAERTPFGYLVGYVDRSQCLSGTGLRKGEGGPLLSSPGEIGSRPANPGALYGATQPDGTSQFTAPPLNGYSLDPH